MMRPAGNRRGFVLDLHNLSAVMPGFMPGIHVFTHSHFAKTWMAGTNPAMTLL